MKKPRITKKIQKVQPVTTPVGVELAVGNECEEPTRIMEASMLRALRNRIDPDRHETVRIPAQRA